MNDERTILLVDDSEDDLFFMRTAFKKAQFGIRTMEVSNGMEAIAYLGGNGDYGDRTRFPLPTVMLLDLNMPLKNGFDVLTWVRAQPGLKRLSIVVLTASMRMADVERAFDLGANAFLVKPGNLEALAAMSACLKEWIQISHYPSLTVECPVLAST